MDVASPLQISSFGQTRAEYARGHAPCVLTNPELTRVVSMVLLGKGTKAEVMAAYCILREHVSALPEFLQNHNLQPNGHNGRGRPTDKSSPYVSAALRHFPIILEQWLARDRMGPWIRCCCSNSDTDSLLLQIFELPPISPATFKRWEGAVWRTILDKYRGIPGMPDSHRFFGLEDLHGAIPRPNWDEHLASIEETKKRVLGTRVLTEADKIGVLRQTAEVFSDKIRHNVRRALKRILENWPRHPELAKYGQHLVPFRQID